MGRTDGTGQQKFFERNVSTPELRNAETSAGNRVGRLKTSPNRTPLNTYFTAHHALAFFKSLIFSMSKTGQTVTIELDGLGDAAISKTIGARAFLVGLFFENFENFCLVSAAKNL
jgi:hypothetical protein